MYDERTLRCINTWLRTWEWSASYFCSCSDFWRHFCSETSKI